MKKTFIYIFLGWMMCAVPLSAQHWDKAIQRAEKAAEKASRKYNGNLNKALKESSAQAKAVYNALKKTKYEKNWLKRNTPLIPPYSKLSSLAQGWILANNQAWLIGAVLQEKNKRQFDIAGWFVGHYHGDYIGKIRGINFILTGSQTAYVPQLWKMPPGGNFAARTLDTVNEDLWDSVLINKKEHKIKIIRFGAGEDRSIEY